MTMKKLMPLAVLCTSALIVTSATAQTSPLSIGASASTTSVKYAGQTETGHTWEANGTLRLTEYSSLYTGYGQTTADFEDSNGIERTLKTSYIPLSLQFTVPGEMGSFYLRGGANYYRTEFGSEKDIGWGATGTVGVKLNTTTGPGLAFELTYADRGDAETSSVTVGTSIGF
ncbi:hypothetical protein BZJ20_08515 [Salinivibrio proteolyticus]|nr:hypothetical protein BZJ20_08515 [Salinivibrio proteolyticus]